MAVDERALRAPTPPPLLSRRRVPMPARSLHLEPVSAEQQPHLTGPVLDQYVRAVDGADGVPILRDLPFGNAYQGGDTPFFMDDSGGDRGIAALDDGDTDGIPVGLPDLVGFTDVAPAPPPAPPPVPAPMPAAPAVAVAPGLPLVPIGVALVVGIVVGLAVGLAM